MVDTTKIKLTPDRTMNVLSQLEVMQLIDKTNTHVYDTFRKCALAVLNTGSDTDSVSEVLDAYADFDIRVLKQERGIKLEIDNAPASALVDGEVMRGIKSHVFAALRDIIYINNELSNNTAIDTNTSMGITNAVFHTLRNAGLLNVDCQNSIVVCWGGHSINEIEYKYTKKVGYELGLRGLDICTGCGPGAMKGPMKGAAIAHAKQHQRGRYIGITEPGIIAAESPNPIVNQLIILPDIEKRLEAFVRSSHGIIVFPGGAGTAEEILYILGILLHPKNADMPMPLIFTGPKESKAYFEQIDAFIGTTLGKEAQDKYTIIIDNPQAVAQQMKADTERVWEYRRANQDAYYFNWLLHIEEDLQKPFEPDHINMSQLALHKDQPINMLASNLRKAFSGIVDGNVKENGIRIVAQHGPYKIHGDKSIMAPLDTLLRSFVDQKRMKIPTREYIPCYELVL